MIKCYNEGNDWQLHQDHSLQSILERLRSDSRDRSPPLESLTLDGFIGEKYPQFKFENGTSRPTSDNDMCMAASLLLLYVCVRAEHAEMRSAMCGGLSREDQEVILKFTKCLMNRSPVTYEDVHTAIIECYGETAPALVAGAADTPPPLRALHGEVRRLRAALDSERFDRSYLQDELAATNGRLDKLLREKEQCQREAASLRAQLAAGRDAAAEEQGRAEEGAEGAARAHARQLAALEERLMDAHAQYEECERARIRCKSKLDETRSERDRLAEIAHAESERALALGEQLESERAAAAALRDALAELRAHRHANAGDKSLLECDDAGTPTERSFAHDTSACGDVCAAAVVEVQLCEERARVSRLTQQLQACEDKVKELEMAALSNEEEIQAKVKYTNELCITFDKEKADMQCKLNENHNVIQNIASQLHELKIEKDSLENQIKNYKSIIDSNQSLIIELKKENEEFKAMNAEITQSSINDIEKLKRDKEMITTQFKHFKTISEESEKVLTTNLEELKITNESIQSKANELSNVISSNQMDNAQLKKEYEQLRDKSEQTIKLLTQDQIAKSKVLEEKVAQLAELQTQNMELQYQNERIATDYKKKLAITSTQSEESKASYEKQINLCKNIINANKLEIDALISEKNDMHASAENISLHFTNEIEELKAKYLFLENNSGKIISSKQNEIQQLENEIATLNVKIGEIRLLNNNQVEDLSNKIVALEKQVCECNNNIESKQTSITQLEMDNNNLATELEEITKLKNIEVKKVTTENETLEMKLKQIQKENTLLQTKISELTAVHTLELSETQKEKEAMDQNISEMTYVLECNQTNNTLLSNENKALKANVDEIIFLKTGENSEQKQIFEKEISELKHTIENNHVEVEQLKKYIKQLENIGEMNRIKIIEEKEMVKHKEAFKLKITDLKDIIESKESKIFQLKNTT